MLLKCTSLRQRLTRSIRTRKDEFNKHSTQLASVKDKFLVSQSVKVLTQKLKRKNQQIRRLKAERTETAETSELQRVRQRLKNCKRQCQRLQSKCANAAHADNVKLTEMMTRLRSRDSYIHMLENDKLLLQERVDATDVHRKMMKPGKAFDSDMRRIVYNGIVNQVPTANIPVRHTIFPSKWTAFGTGPVKMMAREIGVIANLQAAEALNNNNHQTIGFYATTQEGVNLNSIHVTTESHCYVLAIDELPGGTAVEYSTHVNPPTISPTSSPSSHIQTRSSAGRR